MNAQRWTGHFRFGQMVVVNIASAELRYYRQDTLVLGMKVVVGQPSKRTPRFAAWCDGVVLYPYWNVPHKIAIRELLPVFRLAPGVVGLSEVLKLQIRSAEFYDTWIKMMSNPWLVAGSFGRAALSQAFSESFSTGPIMRHRVPVFVAHK